MKNRQHDNPMRFRKKVHGVWEAASLNAANYAVLDWELFGLIGRKLHCPLDLRCEGSAKADLPFFVPKCRGIKLRSRYAAKDDAQGHLFKRAAIED